MKRKTQIISTIGPSCQAPGDLISMAEAGMNIVRINFSHGSRVLHQNFINVVHAVNHQQGGNIRIMQDLEGFRLRIGHLTAPVALKEDQDIWMIKASRQTAGAVPLECEASLEGIAPGMSIFVDDGMILLRVLENAYGRLRLRVVCGGILKSRKGVNIPQLKLSPNVLTRKDRHNIDFGIRNRVDYIAQSFVRNGRDIEQVVERVKPYLPQCLVIAKIESQEGVDHIEEILDACDGIMVARGDLGVSLPIWQVPIIQKDLINRCNATGKMAITATQMLESMVSSMRPTRAEVSDVANSILDGTDAVMLSAETAVGLFPVESVKMMREIIEFTEDCKDPAIAQRN